MLIEDQVPVHVQPRDPPCTYPIHRLEDQGHAD
jgi:hypothetical protein